jgi:hypothetical protein
VKRFLVLILALGLVFGSLATAEAGKKKKVKKVSRTVELAYAAPGFGFATAGAGCSPALGSCGEVPTSAEEKYIKVTLTDASGTPTAFQLSQDTEPGDATNTIETTIGTFCGTTGDEPIEILPGYEITIFPWVWGDAVCPTGFGTTGTMSVELSNLP